MERLTRKMTPLDVNERKSVQRPVDGGWILFIRKSQLNELTEEKHRNIMFINFLFLFS